MSGVIENLERAQLRKLPRFQAGDPVKGPFPVVGGTRRRTQVFEGVVLKRQGSGARETFTVRKQSFGVGVERTFPVHSPKIERNEVASRGDVRRAKLYYLRGRVGRRARVRERQFTGVAEAELLAAEAVAGGTDEAGVAVEDAAPEGTPPEPAGEQQGEEAAAAPEAEAEAGPAADAVAEPEAEGAAPETGEAAAAEARPGEDEAQPPAADADAPAEEGEPPAEEAGAEPGENES